MTHALVDGEVVVPRALLEQWQRRFLGYAPDGVNWNYKHICETIDEMGALLAASPPTPRMEVTDIIEQCAKIADKLEAYHATSRHILDVAAAEAAKNIAANIRALTAANHTR